MTTNYMANLNVMDLAQSFMDRYIVGSLLLDEIESNLQIKIEEYNNELKNEPKEEDYKETYTYTDENGDTKTGTRTKSDFYSAYAAWQEKIATLEQAIKELENNRDDLVEELNDLEQKITDLGYDIKDIKPSENLIDFWKQNSKADDEDGKRRKLTEEEIKELAKELDITDNPNIEVYVTTEEINGVKFKVYDVCGFQGWNDYEKCRQNKLDYLANIDHDVLQYIADYGTNIVMYSDTNFSTHGKEHDWAGYFSGSTRNIYLDNNIDHPETAIHEMGHAFDAAISYNANGNNFFNSSCDNLFEENFSKSFYETVKDEIDAVFDPSNFPTKDFWNYANEQLAKVISNRDYNLDFSNYDKVNIEYAQYLDEKNENPYPIEYFAESFKIYYIPDDDRRKRFEFVIPETFNYISGLENMVKGVDSNENK